MQHVFFMRFVDGKNINKKILSKRQLKIIYNEERYTLQMYLVYVYVNINMYINY